MIAYASRTGTKRNLDAMRVRGFRLLVSATGAHRSEGFPYALDNGAWTSYAQGKPFDERLFSKLIRSMGRDAEWAALPDIVAGAHRSLEMSLRWMRQVLDETELALLPVQNGMTVEDVRPFLGSRVGIFVGGDTGWKLATIPVWARLAREVGVWCHVGRVNTAQRIQICMRAGATSFDGTSVTKFAVTANKIDHARRQPTLFQGE